MNWIKKIGLLVSFGILLSPENAYAQDFWEEVPEVPDSIRIQELFIHTSGNLVLGTNQGVYFNEYKTSCFQYLGLNGVLIYSLTVSPNGFIYAGTNGTHNIYQFKNQTWLPVYSYHGNVLSLTVNKEGHIFAGSGDEYGVLRSMDDGETWDEVLSFEVYQQVNKILFCNSNLIIAATSNYLGEDGVYRSIDNGYSWELTDLKNGYFVDLASNSQNQIFAGGYSKGIFRSADLGLSWINVNDNVQVTSLLITPDNIIYAGYEGSKGVYRSRDNGLLWETVNEGFPIRKDITDLALSPDGYLYAVANEKLYKTSEPVTNYTGTERISQIKALSHKLCN